MAPWLPHLRSSLSKGRSAWLPSGERLSKIAIIDMLAHNWHLGFTSFGGPTVHFQIFRERFVQHYRWVDERTYEELFALCQALSGPASTKMMYAINVMRYGLPTGIAAFFVWSLPMAIAAWGLALGVSSINNRLPAPAYALLSGLNSATVGIIALAAVQLSHKAITDTITRILVFLGAICGMLYNALWFFPVLMAAGGLTTIVWDYKVLPSIWRFVRRRKHARPDPPREEQTIGLPTSEGISAPTLHARPAAQPRSDTSPSRAILTEDYNHNEESSHPQATRSWKTGCFIIAAFFCTFLTVMVCRGIYSSRNRGFDVFANLYLAGTIIFGGGPVVVPLLREYVVAPGWVSSRDFLLGLAITQAFPGPNFNFAVYLGALAMQGSGIPPTAGSIIGFIAIFLPGIWLHTGFISLWSVMRRMRMVRACLRGIHAAAVGLVFTAVYRLFEIGYLDADVQNGGSLSRDPWWVVIVATSFVGGRYFHLVPPLAVMLGAVMGLIWYGVTSA
ncbi:chromate transporter-domain-containing protein [Neohortaea acidophila]|uniref:Chromate transporter-domain-containing protein n=1 Tax=Neohortaea acidophila TaxID=245834 RepID=A0A6A6PSN0_9PEZI|nr:chromate transporter-domain-containing protein [Neohortaea acidophila]KAF2482237.1 chromate transporter-domain-containing protein [Neohortaea acidophila]